MMFTDLLLCSGLLLAATASNVLDVIANNPDTSALFKLISGQPAVASALEEARNITVLAPSNAAFEAFLNSDEGAKAIKDDSIVANLLTYHVVVDGVFQASVFTQVPVFPRTLLTDSSYTSLHDGQRVKIQQVDSNVDITSGLLRTSHVITADIAASNGIIHIIDRVLTIPLSISDTAVTVKLNSLVAALQKTDLVQTLDELPCATVFAPNDEAFEAASAVTSKLSTKELSDVLTYHVVEKVKYSTDLDNKHLHTINGADINTKFENNAVKINTAKVVTADALVSNGVVHVIDQVLTVDPSNHESEHDHDDHDTKDSRAKKSDGTSLMKKRGVITLAVLAVAQGLAL